MTPASSSIRAIAHWCCVTVTMAAMVSFGGCTTLLGDFELAGKPAVDAGTGTLCTADEHRCRDDLLVKCNGAGDAWEVVDTCRAPELCNTVQKRCDACQLGDFRCDPNGLQTCAATKTSWDTTCPTTDLCNLNTRSCRTCEPGDYQCRGNVVQKCTDQGAWMTAQTCDTAELCESETRKRAHCLEAQCPLPGKHFCEGKRLFRCSAGRDRKILIDECTSETLCDSAFADEDHDAKRVAHCKAPTVCQPGAWSCDGVTLQQCNASGTGLEPKMTCASAAQCNPKAKNCSACTPGGFNCVGVDHQQCGPDGGWVNDEQCATPGLCNPQQPLCRLSNCTTPGVAVCDGQNFLQICSPDLEFVKAPGPPCVTKALCNAFAARCESPACNRDAVRCGPDNRLQTCEPSTLSWVNAPTSFSCSEERPCSLTGECVACQVGKARCNDVDLEVCTPHGWERKDHCATPQLCDSRDPTACQPPACRLGEFRCEGPILERCNEARTTFDVEASRTCPSSTICDATTGTCKPR